MAFRLLFEAGRSVDLSPFTFLVLKLFIVEERSCLLDIGIFIIEAALADESSDDIDTAQKRINKMERTVKIRRWIRWFGLVDFSENVEVDTSRNFLSKLREFFAVDAMQAAGRMSIKSRNNYRKKKKNK